MANKQRDPGDADELRRRAEEKAREHAGQAPEERDRVSRKDAGRVDHELRVHQIELEMQNEELRRAQAELEDSRARYFALFDLAPVGYFTLSEQGLILEANLTVATLLGVARGALVRQPLTRHILPEDQDIYYLHRKRLFETGAPQVCEFRMLRADGDPFWARVEAAAAQDVDGAPVCRAVMSDITERKHAEASSEQLHAQLLQAQKMEAIGRLAGGVAHDFNNSVQVILGYIDIALNEISPDNPMRAHLDEIEKAAQRSADLTRKLLAFARKQTIAPRVLDLNATIESLLAILRRLIGEEIDLRWKPAAALWPVKIDPVQVDQMMTNLLLNARDAIAQPAPQSDAPRQASGNGIIIVETENAVYDEAFCLAHAGFLPGQYVRLAVSDDGCGMDWAAQERLFEPYHTTKPLGQGGGLGLATVYGIVKQNGGFLYAQSKPGLGSTFSLYLPRTTETLPPIKTPRRSAEAPSGNETILLVEDEPALLRSACLLLEGLGYTGLAAAGPIQALRVATEHAGTIDLLLTDGIMPEMNGHALWSRLHALRPGMRCVFMSGYPAEIIAHHGVLDEGVNFLQKLFTKQVLAAKVREALETE